MNYYIITGTSSGIGEAIARKLILERHCIFCISRRLNESLVELASSIQCILWYTESDLADISLIPGLMDEIFLRIEPKELSSIALINNAATLDPIGPAGSYPATDLSRHILVNLAAPMLLSSEFIRLTEGLNVPKSIVNIGSGAATTPYAGWGPYCSSKAGLEMFTRTTNLEQQHKKFPVRVLNIAPGVVDTLMQEKLRNTSLSDFPMKSRFEELYLENLLSRPAEVAEKITGLIFGKIPAENPIIDLRKL
ncbi:MAG: SDR family NAD(P)-dependent oxidoreductase [Lentimicrobium sp.]